MNTKTALSRSPLKRWVGSKFDFLETLYGLLPKDVNNIYEPFCGSAAFSLNYPNPNRRIVMNDLNWGIYNFYHNLKFETGNLIDMLLSFEDLQSENFYHTTRTSYNNKLGLYKFEPDLIKAAQFLYLHYTCFNGLYRENSKGEFNVPIGRDSRGEVLSFKVNTDNLLITAKKLKPIDLKNNDYLTLINWLTLGKKSETIELGKKDLVFLDPPYLKTHSKYNANDFTLTNHQELIELVKKLDRKEVYFILFNSDNVVYKEALSKYRVIQFYRKGCVNSDVSKRGKIKELCFTNIKSNLTTPQLI